MARYAVGDLQGCLSPLQCLLNEVSFNPGIDELWLVGDLVNRGPQSLDVLEYLYPMRHSIKVVLGNHDLHTLALARGATTQGKNKSLTELLKSDRLDEFMQWFREMPLCIRSEVGDYVMSHAGIPHIWSTDDALSFSNEVSATLRNDEKLDAFLAEMYGDKPDRWSGTLAGNTRLRTLTNYFTRMRICSEDGTLDLKFKERLEDMPENTGMRPWFDWPPTTPRSEVQLFGHWAALEGKTGRDDCIALDTGCVWGRTLTLFDMDKREFHCCDCASS